eukprot:1394544-Amorphochlora_amoeboformis.AAC.1
MSAGCHARNQHIVALHITHSHIHATHKHIMHYMQNNKHTNLSANGYYQADFKSFRSLSPRRKMVHLRYIRIE